MPFVLTIKLECSQYAVISTPTVQIDATMEHNEAETYIALPFSENLGYCGPFSYTLSQGTPILFSEVFDSDTL